MFLSTSLLTSQQNFKAARQVTVIHNNYIETASCLASVVFQILILLPPSGHNVIWDKSQLIRAFINWQPFS